MKIKRLKRLIRKIEKLSILPKLILGMFMIVVPLYALSFYVNNIGADRNREAITQQLISTVDSYGKLLETEFQRIRLILDNSSTDFALMVLNVEPENLSEKSKSSFILDIRRYLSDIQTSSRFIENTKVFLPGMGETVANISTASEKMNMQEFQELRQEVYSTLFYHYDGHLFMTKPYISHDKSENLSNTSFVMAVQINQYQVKALLDRMTGYKNGGVLFLAEDQAWSISTENGNEVTTQIPEILSKQWEPAVTDIQVQYADIEDEAFIFISRYSRSLNSILIAYVPTRDVFGPLQTYTLFFWLISVLAALSILLFSGWMYKIIHKPLKRLVSGFKRVEQGELSFSIAYAQKDEFGYLYKGFNEMLVRLDELVHDVYEQKIRAQYSELKRLQSQINPHFLYNSFFILSRLIRAEDKALASRFAGYLSEYFKFITRDAADEMLLKDEVKHARTYIDIQSVCYAGRIKISFEELPERATNFKVPRLILQPIIENCFKHAFENKIEDARIHVRFSAQWHKDKRVSFSMTVEDNGEELSDEAIAALRRRLDSEDATIDESTGLYNVHRRIRLRHGEESGLIISRSKMGGLKVELLLNLGTGRGIDAI